MENNRKEDLVFVSFDRLWDNFKKYFWIALILAGIMLIYGAGTYKRTLSMSESDNNIKREPVIIPDKEEDRVHKAEMTVAFTVSVDEYLKTIGVSKDSDIDELSLYQKLCEDVPAYVNAILYSDAFFSSVNEAYGKYGYSELVTSARYPVDNEYDIFNTNSINDMTFILSYTGTGGKGRIRTGGEAAKDSLVELLKLSCPFVTVTSVSNPIISLRVLVNGFFGYYDASEESVERIREEYREYNKVVTNEVEKFDFKVKNLFQISTIIKGVVGFIIGLFIIFIIAVCDKKVRTREELERFFEGEGRFLGELNRNNDVSTNVTAASINAMCEKEGLKNVILTTVGQQKIADILADISVKSSGDGIKVMCADGIEVCPETLNAASKADGTIIVVNGGVDNVHTIKNALSRIGTVNARLLGYILCK